MSPEQAKGLISEIDQRSDIFLLGSTLYTMVTFQVPFSGDDIYEILAHAEQCDFIPPGQRAPDRQIPRELCRIIEKAMESEKQHRYQNVEELCRDLDALMSGNAVSTRRKFSANEYLMKEGEPGYEAYVILNGKVEVTTVVGGNKLSLITLKEGDIIGEMALILQAPRSANVQAIEDTVVLIINEETMKQGLGLLPPWMGKIVDSLADRLRQANIRVHPLLNSNCTYHLLNQIRLLYCYWSTPVVHSEKQETIAMLKTSRLVQEVAFNLSISKERVFGLICTLVDFGILTSYAKEYFYISNFGMFSNFTEFVKNQLEINTGFSGEEMNTSFYCCDGDLVVKHSIKKDFQSIPDCKRINYTPEGERESRQTDSGDTFQLYKNLFNKLREVNILVQESDDQKMNISGSYYNI